MCLHTVKWSNSSIADNSIYNKSFVCTQFKYHTVLFNPWIGAYQVLPFWARVELGAMTMKGYSHCPNLYQILQCHIQDTHLGGGLASFQRCNQYIWLTWLLCNMSSCDIIVSEIEIQLPYFIPFRTNTLEKGMNPLYPSSYGFNYSIIIFSIKMALALNKAWRLMCL